MPFKKTHSRSKLSAAERTALGGIVAALSVVCMMLTSVIPIATYSCPILAGILIVIVVIEADAKLAFFVYCAVSVLSLLLVTDKEAAVYFVLLFGYYPILKQSIERLKPRAVQWILKLCVFNVGVIVAFFITINLLSVPKESFEIGGVYLPWVFLIAGNVVFVLYDAALSGLITAYILKFRKYIFKGKGFSERSGGSENDDFLRVEEPRENDTTGSGKDERNIK